MVHRLQCQKQIMLFMGCVWFVLHLQESVSSKYVRKKEKNERRRE
jgi:hypothetical protein